MQFTVNEEQANSYYNCENVIAVGEIKLATSMKEIKDVVAKLPPTK